MKKISTAFICMIAPFFAVGAPFDDARRLVKEGDFWGARMLLEQIVDDNPKIAGSAEYNYLLGACELESGNYDKARSLLSSARSKGFAQANLYLGKLAFMEYDFEGASEYFNDFKKHREKTGQTAGETVSELEQQLSIAENSLSRVERIEIIDSITVPKEDFFRLYKLSRSSGRIVSPHEIPFEENRQGAVMAYVNEGGDYMMWGEPDSIGNVHIVETIRLTDGTWQQPQPVGDHLSNRYADYPFMMPDGVTLYFSSDGDGSMGGYDIFVATRDASTGEYLQPQNVGMPYNSPFDDYMLAIDEENGIGWWATDRNRLNDKLTVYVYMVNDLRKNYDSDDDDIIEKARITDYRSTQQSGNEDRYSEALAMLVNLDNDQEPQRYDFNFPIGHGEFYHSMTDFKSRAAFDAMNVYMKALSSLQKEEKHLADLRRRYPVNKADNVKEDIVKLEYEIDLKRIELTKLRSNVYRCLKGVK